MASAEIKNNWSENFDRRFKQNQNIKNKQISKELNEIFVRRSENKILYSNNENNTFLLGWNEIENSGQKNCGIYLNVDKPNLIMKCEHVDKPKILSLLQIREKIPQIKLFPKIYEIHNNKYIIMDKLDGDLTQLCFEILPKEILRLDAQYNGQEIQILNYLKKINPKKKKINNLSEKPEIFDVFFNTFIQQLKYLLQFLTFHLIYLEFILGYTGFIYKDRKLDNYAFKFDDEDINGKFGKFGNHFLNNKTYFKRILPGSIFATQFIDVMFLDWNSGLYPISSENNYLYYDIYNHINILYNENQIINYRKYGQSNISTFLTFGNTKYNRNRNKNKYIYKNLRIHPNGILTFNNKYNMALKFKFFETLPALNILVFINKFCTHFLRIDTNEYMSKIYNATIKYFKQLANNASRAVNIRPFNNASRAINTRPFNNSSHAINTRPLNNSSRAINARPLNNSSRAINTRPLNNSSRAVNARPLNNASHAVNARTIKNSHKNIKN